MSALTQQTPFTRYKFVMASFTAQLSAAAREAERYTDAVWRKSVVDAFNKVIISTPFDTGMAKSSWLTSATYSNAIGTTQISPAASQVPKLGGHWLLFSNLPYIQRLEDGSSAQAPEGMVKQVVAAWPAIIRKNGG